MATPRPPSLIHLQMLLALADGDLHGYGIKQAVEQQTDGVVRLGPGTLYEALQRLEQTNLIAEVEGTQADERPRRFYRLTRQGWAVLRAEIERLQRLLDHAQSKPRLRKAGPA